MSKYESFGNLVVRLRLQAGYEKQSDLAAAMDCKQQTVSRWEAGTARPRSDDLPKLAHVLKLEDPTPLYQAWDIYRPFPLAGEKPELAGAQPDGDEVLPGAVLMRSWRYYVSRYGDNGLLELNERGEFVVKATPSRRNREVTARVFDQVTRGLGKGTAPGWPVLTSNFGIRVASIVWAAQVPEDIDNVRAVAPRAPELCIDILDMACPETLRERRVDAWLSSGASEVILVDVEGDVSYWGSAGPLKRSSHGLKIQVTR